MASPPFFYRGSQAWVVGCYVIGIGLLILGSVWGLVFAPEDRLQGDSFRIIYFHVPSAHLSELVYVAIAVAGFVFLVWRMKMADVFMRSAAPVGAVLTAFALLSGIIWGIPTWGTGWVWDARTTSMLVQLFLFIGLISLRSAIPNQNRAVLAVSILALVGVINIPIIKYSVDWFNTLHQPASIQIGRPVAIDMAMLWPLLINTLGLYTFTAGVILSFMRTFVLASQRDTDWVNQHFNVGQGGEE